MLDHFCFKLSDKQFRHLLKNLNLCEDFTVDWKVFLKNIDHLIEVRKATIYFFKIYNLMC